MNEWNLRLKSYPHFDAPISAKQARLLVANPERVAQHRFFPFILTNQRWNRFAKKGESGDEKKRPIRCAARADAYIFSYYRHLLASSYEAELARLGLSDSIIAYRSIPTARGRGGKCNIHHMLDATKKIREFGDCCVIALDISSFFETLDHELLKSLWCRLLGVPRLPNDHFKVFEAITSYSTVEREAAFERLGHYGVKRIGADGAPINGYLTPAKKIPTQLCRGSEFREKIAGGCPGQPTIIRRRMENYGIPQGSPISDLLANLYLIDFDTDILRRVQSVGGAYLRYSDDILLIVPVDEASATKLELDVRNSIGNFGRKLKIKQKKSAIFEFRQAGENQTCRRILGTQGRNGFEYLGFRYNGRRIFLRDSTLSNLWRRIASSARREAIRAARRYRDKNKTAIVSLFGLDQFITRFGRVEDFKEKHDDYKNWTFLTYAKRASKLLGPLGSPIARQLRKHRERIRARVALEIEAAVTRRDLRLARAKGHVP